MDEFRLIEEELLVASPTNPRKHFPEEEINELSQSIQSVGIIEPLVVRKFFRPIINSDEQEIVFEIVCGERRYRASKLAGLKFLPCMVKNLNDDQVFEIQITENLQRQDVSPLDECDAFLKLKAKKHYSIEDLSIKFGKSQEYIFSRMRLSALVPEAIRLLEENIIPITAAITISTLPSKSQSEAIKRTVVPSTVNGKEKKIFTGLKDLRIFLDNNILIPLTMADFDTEDANLCPDAGSCSTCIKRTGKDFFEHFDSNKCMDNACFKNKSVTHYQSLADQLAAKHKSKVVFAARHYAIEREYKELGSVVEMVSYQVVDKKTKNAVMAVFIGTDRSDSNDKPRLKSSWIEISEKVTQSINKKEKRKEAASQDEETEVDVITKVELYKQFVVAKRKTPLTISSVYYHVVKLFETLELNHEVFEDILKRYNLVIPAEQYTGVKWESITLDSKFKFNPKFHVSMDFDDIYLSVLKIVNRERLESLLSDLTFVEAQNNENMAKLLNHDLDLKEAKRKANEYYKSLNK